MLLYRCENSDGSACAIVNRMDMAKNFRPHPIYLKGFGLAMDTLLSETRPGFDWISFDTLLNSASKGFGMASIKNLREQIDWQKFWQIRPRIEQ